MGAEKPPHSRDEVAGSHREPGSERQTTAADTDATGAQTEKLMEEVLHAENLHGDSRTGSRCFGHCSGPFEPPCTDPYARWCGGTGRETSPPTR